MKRVLKGIRCIYNSEDKHLEVYDGEYPDEIKLNKPVSSIANPDKESRGRTFLRTATDSLKVEVGSDEEDA